MFLNQARHWRALTFFTAKITRVCDQTKTWPIYSHKLSWEVNLCHMNILHMKFIIILRWLLDLLDAYNIFARESNGHLMMTVNNKTNQTINASRIKFIMCLSYAWYILAAAKKISNEQVFLGLLFLKYSLGENTHLREEPSLSLAVCIGKWRHGTYIQIDLIRPFS